MRLALLLAIAACDPHSGPAPVSREAAAAIALGASLAPDTLTLPSDSRDGLAPPERVVLGPWVAASTLGGTTVYQAELPARPRSLFFSSPPPGMRLFAGEVEIPHRGEGGEGSRWAFDATRVRVEIPGGAPLPEAIALEWPTATAREASLNLAFSGVDDPLAFALRSVQVGPEARAGLFLPAPAVASWVVEIPVAAELRFAAGLVPPELRDAPASDGATLLVEVEVDGERPITRRFELGERFEDARVDLSALAGREARLTLRTEPGPSSRFDYAFVADPVLASRLAAPRRVVVLFVDTLRADHLGLYGYERPTSPTIDALGQGAAVFDAARSVAPWTLPTARTLLTGRQPERFEDAPTLPGVLRERGWATAMLAGNVYLSANFGLERDWGLHRVVNWPGAAEQVDLGLAWLATQEGRDALLLLHFMDPHLPYLEPASHRRLFAGDAVGGLGEEFHRSGVLRAPLRDEAVREYVTGRYDNNIRYVDDELSRVLAALGPEDVVILLSDHGEELWDHGGFEHGHTLYEELLRVPLIVRAPGVSAARIDAPVSLLDVAPTILELVGAPPVPAADGRSLAPLLHGDSGAAASFAARDLAFGRPLYGPEAWGVLHGAEKWTVREGDEDLFDLAADPGERRDLARAGPSRTEAFPERLGAALGTEVRAALRLNAGASRVAPAHDLVIALTVPGGVDAAWVGEDPAHRSSADVCVAGDTVIATWHRGFRGPREVWVVPAAPIDAIAPTLEGELRTPTGATPLVREDRVAPPGTEPAPLLSGALGSRSITVSVSPTPLPVWAPGAIAGFDAELAEMLQAMGYAVGPGAAPEPPTGSPPTPP